MHTHTHTQSMETDELIIQSAPINSPTKSPGRARTVSESGSVEFQRQPSLHRQGSVKRQISTTANPDALKKQVSVKDQEAWDKELPEAGFLKVIRLNAKEWWIILIGVLASAIGGAIFPVFGIVLGETLGAFSLPVNEVVSGVSLYAGLFWVLGFVAGLGFFIKVSCTEQTGLSKAPVL